MSGDVRHSDYIWQPLLKLLKQVRMNPAATAVWRIEHLIILCCWSLQAALMYLGQTTAVPGGRKAAGEEAESLCQHESVKHSLF